MSEHNLNTSEGGRAYLVEYFATRLRRHDFQRYIEERIAADFACALAKHLSETTPSAGEAAMQRACAELPFGYDLRVCLEEGAGWVELFDPTGKEVDVTEDMDGGMTPRIVDAIERAVEHAKDAM